MRRSVTSAVVFDLGGVLIDLHSTEARSELIQRYGLRPERFDRLSRSCFTWRRRSITELAMIGRVETAEYLEAFLRECSVKDLAGIRKNRLSVLGSERRDVFQIVSQLKQAGSICCVFSNTIALHWEKLASRRHYPSLAHFDGIFPSHLIGQAKPRKSAFAFVAKALNLHMAECLLIDDTPLNVAQARAAGWRALLFTDTTKLQRELAAVLA